MTAAATPSATTQADLAAKVGLSVMTVHRALTGHPHVADRTRRRVQDAAKQIGYRVNTAARTTRTGRFGAIALLQGTRDGRSSLPQQLLDGIQVAASEREVNLMLVKYSDERLTDPAYVPRMLREVASDGLLIDYTHGIPQRMLDLIRKTQTPAVWINSKQAHDCVHPDDYQAGRDATAHLAGLGHRDIAYADFTHGSAFPNPHYSSIDRLSGYLDEMADRGFAHRVIRAEGEIDIAGGRRQSLPMELLGAADRPTAVICFGSTTAAGFYHAAYRLRLDIPGQLSLVLFGNEPETTLIPVPTSMIVPYHEIGRRAVSMLCDKIATPPEQLEPLSLPFSEFAGASAGPPADFDHPTPA
jgi:DNA-binding LacI/PurR family transcriptional regulator